MIQVSVVVPVYNVKDYLEDCLNSIVSQSYHRLDIILINDGSTDGSNLICEKYVLKDQRIRLFDKPNGGLSSARNFGIEKAQGDFICFVDSDDIIDKLFVEKLLLLVTSYAADIVSCSFLRFCDSIPNFDKPFDQTYAFSGNDMLKNIYKKEFIPENVMICNKLFRTELWKDIRFPLGVYHEDEYVIHELYARSSKVVLTNDTLYYYRQRLGSIMNTITSKRFYDIINLYETRRLFFANLDMEREVSLSISEKNLNIARIFLNSNSAEIDRIIKDFVWDILMDRNIGTTIKFSVFMKAKMNRMYFFLRSIRNKMKNFSIN